MTKILIATSIAPRNIALQQAAISTWHDFGFQVVAVNTDSEISSLKPHFPNIEFFSVAPRTPVKGGRVLVLFDDVLTCLQQSSTEVCGIINSDISLHSKVDFLPFILKQAKDSLVFGSRIDIDIAEVWEGTYYGKGYDYFFLDKKLLKAYPPSSFHIGAPWWDIWAPLLPILRGYNVKKFLTPIAYHVKHEAIWGEEWNHYATHLAHLLLPFSEKNKVAVGGHPWGNLCQTILQGALAQNEILNLKNNHKHQSKIEAAQHFQIFFYNMLSTFLPQYINQEAIKISISEAGD